MPEQRTAKDRKQHLYLVFDDWNSGYSIRKVNLSRRAGKRSEQSSDSGEDSEQPALSSGSGKGAKHLPVFMRIPGPRGYPQYFTSAFGTKIMAMHPVPSYDLRAGVPTIDVQEKTISFERLSNSPAFPFFIPVSDDRLFHQDFSTIEVLWKPEPSGLWMWRQLPSPPFMVQDISYGVQPDGCILVSIKRGVKSGITFIFDTKENVWKQYSDWVFPFAGHGYYDLSLEGFVGLSKDPETLGYLHCCTMASTTTGDTGKGLHPSPDFKKVKVYNKNPAEGQHVSATLVHMRQGKFCLVQCVCTDNRPIDQEELKVPQGAGQSDLMGGGPQGSRFMYRLKTFSLSYDQKGDLKLKHCKVHCYSLPHEARIGSVHRDPVAFWL